MIIHNLKTEISNQRGIQKELQVSELACQKTSPGEVGGSFCPVRAGFWIRQSGSAEWLEQQERRLDIGGRSPIVPLSTLPSHNSGRSPT